MNVNLFWRNSTQQLKRTLTVYCPNLNRTKLLLFACEIYWTHENPNSHADRRDVTLMYNIFYLPIEYILHIYINHSRKNPYHFDDLPTIVVQPRTTTRQGGGEPLSKLPSYIFTALKLVLYRFLNYRKTLIHMTRHDNEFRGQGTIITNIEHIVRC